MELQNKSSLRGLHNSRLLSHATVSNGSSSSRWRRSRFPPTVGEVDSAILAPTPPPKTPTPASKPENRQSRMSVFNLFSKPKVEKARGHHESDMPAIIETSKVIADIIKPNQERKPATVLIKPKPQKNALRLPRPSQNWDPLPLSQAYSESIIHSTLQSSSSSAESIMRTHSHRRHYNALHDKLESTLDLTRSDSVEKQSTVSQKRLSHTSIIHSSTYTSKIYILVTSGYVLQYAAEGPPDRLPQKILQLGKESAAFACDLIPGKHYVLQVSQVANEDGAVCTGQTRSFLSRLRSQNFVARHTVNNFLLVFETADLMGTWLSALRKEIDGLGGMPFKSDIDSRSNADLSEKPTSDILSEKASIQQPVYKLGDHRSSGEDAATQSPSQSLINQSSNWENENRSSDGLSNDFSAPTLNRLKRQSTSTSSTTTTVTSNDQVQLNHLRGSSQLSFSSSGTNITLPTSTSHGSSSTSSPQTETFPTPELEPRNPTTLRSFHMNPSPNGSCRRRSVQTLPTTSEDGYSGVGSLDKPRGITPHRLSPHTASQSLTMPLSSATSFSYPRRPPGHVSPPKVSPIYRSSSAPPPRCALPPTPSQNQVNLQSNRSLSTFGPSPTMISPPTSSASGVISAGNPPFRPIPIRVSSDSIPKPPRRFSSLAPPLAINPANAPSSRSSLQQHGQQQQQQRGLRRPTSMQIRSNPAPFLSSYRPQQATNSVRSVSAPLAGPLFKPLPGPMAKPSGSPPAPVVHDLEDLATTENLLLQGPFSPSTLPQMDQLARLSGQKGMTRRSMPVVGLSLPPPNPPPNMPLPPPPPVAV